MTKPRNPVTIWGICQDHPHLLLCKFRPPATFPQVSPRNTPKLPPVGFQPFIIKCFEIYNFINKPHVPKLLLFVLGYENIQVYDLTTAEPEPEIERRTEDIFVTNEFPEFRTSVDARHALMTRVLEVGQAYL